MKICLFLFFVALQIASPLSATTEPLPLPAFHARPRLVVVIAIDQFRADYLTRFHSRFLPNKGAKGQVGGFNYLMSGAYFPFGQYDILQSMTGPGHATILSGAYPYQSGIPLNDWFDEKEGKSVYCAEDDTVNGVGAVSKPSVGQASPRNLLATTVGDELKNAGFPTRAISIALKDRASIFMGGHRADLALWLDARNFQWVSSTYYLPDGKLPEWVANLNALLKIRTGKTYQWVAAGKPTGLSGDNRFVRIGKWIPESFGKEFPHVVKVGTEESLDTPLGLELTEEAAEKAIESYRLGQGKSTDLLTISFSSHDYVGHTFGPNSLEMEEMTVADDRVLSRLFNFIKNRVPGGLINTLVVLTADHGIPPNPEWLATTGIQAGRFNEDKLKERLEAHLNETFGKPSKKEWIARIAELNIYFEERTLKEKDVTRAKVEQAVKTFLKGTEGIAYVFTSSDYENRSLPPGMFQRQILKTYFPNRSGDVILIPRPFFFSGDSTVTHMTGYNYDRTVPVLFAGPHIRPGVYSSAAEVVDIAPTLSFLLGTVAPSVSEGRVLSEMIRP